MATWSNKDILTTSFYSDNQKNVSYFHVLNKIIMASRVLYMKKCNILRHNFVFVGRLL